MIDDAIQFRVVSGGVVGTAIVRHALAEEGLHDAAPRQAFGADEADAAREPARRLTFEFKIRCDEIQLQIAADDLRIGASRPPFQAPRKPTHPGCEHGRTIRVGTDRFGDRWGKFQQTSVSAICKAGEIG
ncbi:hypothetical protein [Rhizobium laguerreae]|uniref:hypothetical protein n=1 Tax=Rhizobium laguerreae TaxID=1076926 RepID=UPI0021B128D7|nr:hypothetical protein [Rhizobium laguerreae]